MKLNDLLDTIGYDGFLEEGVKREPLIPVNGGGTIDGFDQYPKYVTMPNPEGSLACRKFSEYVGSRATVASKPSPISVKHLLYDMDVDVGGNIQMLGPLMSVITRAFLKGGAVAKTLLKTTAGPYKSAIANVVRDVAWDQYLKIKDDPGLAVELFNWAGMESRIRVALESREVTEKFIAESGDVPTAYPMPTKVLTPLGVEDFADASGAVSLGAFFANQVTLALQSKYSNIAQAKRSPEVYMKALLNVASGVWGGRAEVPVAKTGDAENTGSKKTNWYSDEDRDDADINIKGHSQLD